MNRINLVSQALESITSNEGFDLGCKTYWFKVVIVFSPISFVMINDLSVSERKTTVICLSTISRIYGGDSAQKALQYFDI